MFTNNLNPILFQWQFLTIRWYGLFLAMGVGLSIWLIYKLFKEKNYPQNLALDLCTWLIIGGLIGARIGYILFYQAEYFWNNPLQIIFINHGGLSSHGMTIGLLTTFFLFIRFNSSLKKGRLGGLLDWRKILDILVIPIPLLAVFIRLGNFFNSEIIGRATNLPWGVYFPRYETNPILRHPTQLYEAITALTIFFILYSIFKKFKKLPQLFIFHLFLLIYFSSRFLLEFTKEYQVGWENFLTAGQWLSLPFILYSIYWFIKNKKTP